MKKFSIKTTIIGSFILIFLGYITATVLTINSLNKDRKKINEIYSKTKNEMMFFDKLEINYNNGVSLLYQSYILKNKNLLERAKNRFLLMVKLIDSAENKYANLLSPKETYDLNKIKIKIHSLITKTIKEFNNGIDSGNLPVATIQKIDETSNLLKNITLKLASKLSNKIEISVDEINSNFETVLGTLIIIYAILTLILFISFVILRNYLWLPLLDISKVIEMFKQGQLNMRFKVSSENEIGKLKRDLNEMAKELSKLVQGIKNASDAMLNHSTNLASAAAEMSTTNEQTKCSQIRSVRLTERWYRILMIG